MGREELLAAAQAEPSALEGVAALDIRGNFMFDPASHRDFLGALVGTGPGGHSRCPSRACCMHVSVPGVVWRGGGMGSPSKTRGVVGGWGWGGRGSGAMLMPPTLSCPPHPTPIDMAGAARAFIGNARTHSCSLSIYIFMHVYWKRIYTAYGRQ
jgi:hypothetical protein